jgi:hypothetical protein
MNNLISEGKGFEQDYDNYQNKPNRQYATADVWWETFANNGIGQWQDCLYKNELMKAVNHNLKLAMVIHYFIGANYKDWLHKTDIEELGGLSPQECLTSDYGMKRLRMFFMQMPG